MSTLLENNDIEIDGNVINLDFRNKDILYFLKGSFLDKNNYSGIYFKYDLVEIVDDNNYSSPYFYLDNYYSESNHTDGSIWNEIYQNNFKKGEYFLTEIGIDNSESYTNFERPYKYEDDKKIFNDWSEEDKNQLSEIGLPNSFIESSILINPEDNEEKEFKFTEISLSTNNINLDENNPILF